MIRTLFCLALLFCGAPVLAAPGAHGPNGEHLDAPGGVQAGAASSIPHMEAATEDFELTAKLYGEELSVLLDRFATNEPVLNAKVELEYRGIKAVGQFHADHGDYSITDVHLLKALSQPGKHPLLFTVLAGNDSDLIEGTLEVPMTAAHAHGPAINWLWLIVAALLLAALAVVAIVHRRRSLNTVLTGQS